VLHVFPLLNSIHTKKCMKIFVCFVDFNALVCYHFFSKIRFVWLDCSVTTVGPAFQVWKKLAICIGLKEEVGEHNDQNHLCYKLK